MATVDLIPQGTTGHPARQFRKEVYKLSASVNLATAASTKGSALASSDVLQVIQIPNAVHILGGSVRVTAIAAGGVTTAKMDVGTGLNVNSLVHDAALLTAGFSAPGTSGSLAYNTIIASADTVDLILRSITGSITSGTVEVNVYVCDVS